jgi:hypothetical protein
MWQPGSEPGADPKYLAMPIPLHGGMYINDESARKRYAKVWPMREPSEKELEEIASRLAQLLEIDEAGWRGAANRTESKDFRR